MTAAFESMKLGTDGYSPCEDEYSVDIASSGRPPHCAEVGASHVGGCPSHPRAVIDAAMASFERCCAGIASRSDGTFNRPFADANCRWLGR